jgi:hypothetical protein
MSPINDLYTVGIHITLQGGWTINFCLKNGNFAATNVCSYALSLVIGNMCTKLQWIMRDNYDAIIYHSFNHFLHSYTLWRETQ